MKILNNLAVVKRSIKKLSEEFLIDKVNVWMEEFGEGFNVYIDVTYITGNYVPLHEYFTMAEEEKKYKAKARIERIKKSLEKMDCVIAKG